MIASAKERNESTVAIAEGREEAYALRRELVRRLQASTRGVSRRERVTAWRNFADAWREAVSEGRLAEFSGILKGEREVGPEAGMLGRLAAGLGVVQVGGPRENGVFQPGAFLRREGAAPRVNRTETEPSRGGRAGLGRGDRQVELFAPGLAVQPL